MVSTVANALFVGYVFGYLQATAEDMQDKAKEMAMKKGGRE